MRSVPTATCMFSDLTQSRSKNYEHTITLDVTQLTELFANAWGRGINVSTKSGSFGEADGIGVTGALMVDKAQALLVMEVNIYQTRHEFCIFKKIVSF